jgi:hypothetical protein
VTNQRAGPVERGVRAELRRLRASVTTDGSAALAAALARQIDTARGAVAAAAAAGQLRVLLMDLRAEAEKRPERDVIDDLNARRAAKRAAG